MNYERRRYKIYRLSLNVMPHFFMVHGEDLYTSQMHSYHFTSGLAYSKHNPAGI